MQGENSKNTLSSIVIALRCPEPVVNKCIKNVPLLNILRFVSCGEYLLNDVVFSSVCKILSLQGFLLL